MKLLSKYLLLFFLGITFQSCSQKKESVINQNPNITADNIVEEIAKQVKYYPKEVVYNLEYDNYYCLFDLLVNDIPAQNNFDTPLGGSAIEINNILFKNGHQKITYKMYPAGKIEDQDKEYKTLRDNTYLKFELSSYDSKDKEANAVSYMEYKTPSTEIKISEGYSEQKFVGAGKTYYEGSFDINVDVPYNLNAPFENAQDLRKFDQKKLESKLLAEYKKISRVYQNKQYDNMAKLAFDNLKSTFISSYESKDEIKKAWEHIISLYKNSEIEMQPVENYKMEFFGDGKLVAFITKSEDTKLRGKNALLGKLKKDGNNSTFEIRHFFYIPQGETEFKVY